ncbi:MAG: recombinase family protein [Terracidiphilus sp.]|jgi:DNA invertase Pin-like site-specific DNA recombinase
MSTLQKRSIRCAVYTRKSSEEGLEQSFNSLDAQREACQAYILSQRQEGWRAIDAHYDDGGYSGGSMERPGLKSLLADIEAKKIDTVVVYKVDRLTRSLADFAKIIEVFDARGVSFVSVTQQFNTTSSMGRLTLNVLLSFAQFEREVTGERIRDKIAASKRKGMWMGGPVPLGYDINDRHLILNEKEAEQIREIFRLYLEIGCVKQLKAYLDKRGVKSKIRVGRSGRSSGGAEYSRGALYKILQNRIYLGEIPHKGQSYPGEHSAIVDRELWERVRTLMAENVRARRHGTNANAPSLLRGLLYDEDGSRFTPSHAVKRGKRYRYYVSQRVIEDAASASVQPGRIPARELEKVVLNELKSFFSSADQVVSALADADDDLAITQTLIESAVGYAKRLDGNSPSRLSEMLETIVARILVHQGSVEIQINREKLRAQLLGSNCTDLQTQDTMNDFDYQPIALTIETRLKRCGGEMRLIIPSQSADRSPDNAVPALIKAISRAHEWVRQIVAGEYKDQRAIAAATGLNERYVSRIIQSAFLAPEIVEAIVKGRQAPELTLAILLDEVPFSWAEQNAKIAVVYER